MQNIPQMLPKADVALKVPNKGGTSKEGPGFDKVMDEQRNQAAEPDAEKQDAAQDRADQEQIPSDAAKEMAGMSLLLQWLSGQSIFSENTAWTVSIMGQSEEAAVDKIPESAEAAFPELQPEQSVEPGNLPLAEDTKIQAETGHVVLEQNTGQSVSYTEAGQKTEDQPVKPVSMQEVPDTETVQKAVQPESKVYAEDTMKEEAGSEKKTELRNDSELNADIRSVQSEPVTAAKSEAVQRSSVSDEIAPEYMEKLNDTIAKQIASGRQEFEIQLDPQHLGKLVVKVAYEAGKAAVSIVCTEAKALQAMSLNAKELGSILETHLGTQTEVVIDKGEPSDYLDQEQQQEQRNREQESKQNRHKNENAGHSEKEVQNFLQQLRLGLA